MLRNVDLLAQELRELGLTRGSSVMIHASLRKLGPVEDGANGLLDAIQQVVGFDGTLLMVLGALTDVPFDAMTTPAEESIGTLAEVFRQRPETRVNDHVVARFGASGRNQEFLLENTPVHDYYGPDSVLDRFVRLGGFVLRLGADLNTVTLTHWAEYLVEIPEKRRVRLRYERADTGEQWIESLDDSNGIVDWAYGDYFEELLTDYLSTGKAKVGVVGGCTAELIDANDYVRFAVNWMEENL